MSPKTVTVLNPRLLEPGGEIHDGDLDAVLGSIGFVSN